MKVYILAPAISVILFSCKKESGNDVNPGDTGSIVLEFDNVYASTDLELNSANYTNGAGEQFTISAFDYYISNIKLRNTSGVEYEVPKDSSYFLVKEEDESTHEIELHGVPAGDYNSITFTIGVDSIKSVSPISERTGALDPAGQAAGMYWTWNSGYIFLKMEGSSPVSTTADKKIYYHIGGFGGFDSPTMNNIKTVTVNSPAGMDARIRKDAHHAPAVHIFADAARVLNGTENVSIAAHSMVYFSEISATIANNYSSMFNIDHIHND